MSIEYYMIIWAMGAFISLQVCVNVIGSIVVLKLDHSRRKEREARCKLLEELDDKTLRIRYLLSDFETMHRHLTSLGYRFKEGTTDKGFCFITSIEKGEG